MLTPSQRTFADRMAKALPHLEAAGRSLDPLGNANGLPATVTALTGCPAHWHPTDDAIVVEFDQGCTVQFEAGCGPGNAIYFTWREIGNAEVPA